MNLHSNPSVILSGEKLGIQDVDNVARLKYQVRVTRNESVLNKIRASRDYVNRAIQNKETIYGVTTAFGGMSNLKVPAEMAAALQNNLPWPHKTGAGRLLSEEDVRAAMLLRANALLKGSSGVRLELIQRFVDCLNLGIVPHVHELGSIGASGDLVPLSHILGALLGLDPAFKVSMHGESLDSVQALQNAGLQTMTLAPKEGLAVINGTSVMSGSASNCISQAQILLLLSLGANALFLQALGASNQAFHPYVQSQKPHPGQNWVAEHFWDLLQDSCLIKEEFSGKRVDRGSELVQDRYSLRCLPQFLGPVFEGLATICRQVEVELNSATDNPLIDPEQQKCYYCGNFLGQHIGMAMDQLRYYLGLVAKQLDVQIALLISPELNHSLPPSLLGNENNPVNLGLKGLQLTANSIAPLVSYLGNSLVDRFPTHAEQFNQNLNSQGLGSANLARQSLEWMRQLVAISLMFGLQGVDLRTKLVRGDYDVAKCLSRKTWNLYKGILEILDMEYTPKRPYIWDDREQSLDRHIYLIDRDIQGRGVLVKSLCGQREELKKFIWESNSPPGS